MDSSYKIYALIKLSSETFFDGFNNAPTVIPAMSNGSIQPAIERPHIGVMEEGFAVGGQKWKPRLDFLHGVLIEMAAVDKQYVDGRLNAPLRTPILEKTGKFNVVGFDKVPKRRFATNSATVIEIYADQKRT